MKLILRMLFLTFLALFVLASIAMAQTEITLAWDPSAGEPLDQGEGGGYRIYDSKHSMQYGETPIATVAEGPNQVTIDTSTFRGRHYFVATAFYIESGETFESDYSNEVSHPFRPEPPGQLRKVANAALYPAKKVGSFFAGLFGKDKKLKKKDAIWDPL